MGHPHLSRNTGSLLPRVDSFSALHVGLHPAEDALPAFAVVDCGLRCADEALVAEFHHRSGARFLRAARMQSVHGLRFEIPIHYGSKWALVTGDPGGHEAAGRIDFEIFALDAELGAIGADSRARPLASYAKVGGAFCDAVESVLA